MSKNRLTLGILFLFTLISFILLIQKHSFCEERTPKTVVTVLEGEVSCFPNLSKEGETRVGILVSLEKKDIAIVDIYEGNVRAYIPDVVRKTMSDKLVPDARILLKKNVRRIQGTNWDIVAVEHRVKAGDMFSEDMVKKMSLEEVFNMLNIWEEMQKITYAEIGEAELIRTYARDLTFIEHPLPKEVEEEDEYPEITFGEETRSQVTITTSTPLPQAGEGTAYNKTLEASGGTGSYSWSIVSGSLPSGLSLSSGGVISGTLGQGTIGTYTFTVKAVDSSGSDATKEFGLEVVYAVPTFRFTQITNNGTADTDAFIDNPWIVWVGNDGDDEIFFCNANNPSNIVQLTHNTDPDENPRVRNGKVVWEWGLAASKEIMYADLTTEITTRITNDGVEDRRPQVNRNGWVVWEKWDGADFQIHYWDGTSTTQLTNDLYNHNRPQIDDNNWIVWEGDSGPPGNTGEIYYWDGSSTNQLTNDAVDDRQPQIDEGKIVWVNNAETSNAEIYYWDGSVQNISNNPGNQDQWPFIESGKVVWYGAYGGPAQIFYWDGTRRVLERAGYNCFPCISEGKIAWQGIESGGWDVFYWDGTSMINLSQEAGIVDVSGENIRPDISQGRIVFLYNDGTDMEIYLAERISGSDPTITGRVYDSSSGDTIGNVSVRIYEEGSNTALYETYNNPYSFSVANGYCYLRAEAEGYMYPSSIVSGAKAGDHGDVFYAGGDSMTLDLPMDKGYPLEITKTANKKRAVIGEIITYNIKIKNKSYWEITDIELMDKLVNGFKYISESTYSGNNRISDPTQNGRTLVYNLGRLEGRSTYNINYQVRVGVGMSPGRYKSTAVARDYVRNWQMSNESSYTVEVIEDPLFTKGTIIGKVFWDWNSNGIQDVPLTPPSPRGGEGVRSTGEGGISGVKIYTEYGVVVETDSDGKYHIADVPPGQHLLKVDPTSLPAVETSNQKPVTRFTTENPYYVKITEGLLAKVNFGVKPLTPPSPLGGEGVRSTGAGTRPSLWGEGVNNFFIVALGEGEVRKIDTSGNIDMVEKDDRYDEGLKVDGRLALFLKGRVLGKYLITASLDTERRPGGKYDTRKLFTNLDPDKYYPVYGDASKVDYSGVDTQDILYVLIEWDESFAKWGNFHTEIPLYERTISGGIIEYKSTGKTKFKDNKTHLKVFGAFSRQMPAHDELVGTGGSLYYLRHKDVIEGSEKVKVEVRDRITRRTTSVIFLREEIDYEIDYDTGRLLLKRPLNSITQPYIGSIISNDILAGNSTYLVIDYEYYSNKGLSNQAEGIKGSQWIGNHIRAGGTYIEEQRPGDPYKLMGGDATIKISPKLQIDGSYHRTEETLLDNGMSYDGGITFTEQNEDYSDNKSGSAVNVNGTAELFKNTDVYLEYSRQDPYYSISGSIANQGSQKYVADIITRLTKNLAFGINHITQRYFEGTIGEEIIGSTRSDTTSGIIDYRKGRWDIRTEYQHREVENPTETSIDTYFGTLPLLKNDFIGVRVGYELFKWLHPYIRGQLTLNGPSNDQGTVGSEIRIWDKGEIDLSYTKGTIGDSALIGLTTRYGEDTDIFTNIETGNNLQLGRYVKTSYGQTTTTKEGNKIYMAQDYSTYREKFVRGSILGYDKKINDILTAGFTYERSHTNSRRLEVDRDSGSVSLSYLDNDFLSGLKGFNKLELRADKGTYESRQWVTQNDILLRVTTGLTLSGRCNWGWTEDRDNHSDLAEFYEAGTGFSYRPPLWDKLNILGKYSYIMDLGPEGQQDFIQITKALRNVYALEGVYDIFKYLSIVGKIAYRAMSEKVGPRDWVDSDTYLYLGRANFHIIKKWDIAAEYRTLANREIEDTKSGWLIEVDREITDYIRFGVGYNFTDYDDDLRNDDNWDAKGWFVRVSGKY